MKVIEIDLKHSNGQNFDTSLPTFYVFVFMTQRVTAFL
jgi:hypothetical protein